MLAALWIGALMAPGAPLGDAGFVEEAAQIASEGVVLEGCWLFPDTEAKCPCVVIAGGTMSHTRLNITFIVTTVTLPSLIRVYRLRELPQTQLSPMLD